MPRTHKTLPRLFVEMPLSAGGEVALGKDQSLYLASVLRKRAGDAVVLFNGRDGAWLAELEESGKKAVTLKAVAQIALQTPPSDLWYGFAPLKQGRLDYMIQKATEMGVGTIQPVITQHTQVTRINLDRVRANAVEAAEQCEVLSVPQVSDTIQLRKLVDEWPRQHGARKLIFCDEGQKSASPLEAIGKLEGQPTGILIGPEGGFTEEERTLLLDRSFVVPISLGPRILRADTAAVAALALVQSIIGDWR